MRHKVPRDTDSPDDTCYTRYLKQTAIAYGRLISVGVVRSGRFFESPLPKGSAPQERGIPGAVSKERRRFQ